VDGLLIARQVLQLLVSAGFGWFLFRSYRSIRQRSDVLGAVFAAGLLLRAVAGLGLFWTSYLGIPIAESLQYQNGFWTPASDAYMYYVLGAHTAEFGFGTLAVYWPSPFYIIVLGWWMSAVGISPAAGLFLNVCAYAGLCRVLVWLCAPANDWRRDLPCIAAFAGLSFSPILLFNGTQTLKEDLTYCLLFATCVGVLIASRALIYKHARESHLQAIFAGVVLAAAATFCLSAIRWYYGAMVWSALAGTLAVFMLVGRTTSVLRYVSLSGVALTAVGVFYVSGMLLAISTITSPRDRASVVQQLRKVTSIRDVPALAAYAVARSRRGFLALGGDTTVVVPFRDAPAVDAAARGRLTAAQYQRVESATPRTAAQHVRVLAIGFALQFVPVILLKALSVVDLSGNEGLMSVADLDVLFLDAVTLVALITLWRRRTLIGDRLPFVVFSLLLAFITAALLAYVVANVGTLVRLRLLVCVPIWVASAVGLMARPADRPSATT
jgi:hypothetical protein